MLEARSPTATTLVGDTYRQRQTATEVSDDTSTIRRRYELIANQPKYKHFARIPERIIRSLDCLGIEFDRELVRARLQAHYLFIGVVDDAIDSNQPDVGRLIFESLRDPVPHLENGAALSEVGLVTEFLKVHIEGDLFPLVVNKLREAYQEVRAERAAPSIDQYIEHRKSLGRATAEQSYFLIQSALKEDKHDDLFRFMRDVGAAGCLIDSVIDLRRDCRLGLLNFAPTVGDYAKLCLSAVSGGLRVWIRRPRMTGLFLEAIIDNLRDRNRNAWD